MAVLHAVALGDRFVSAAYCLCQGQHTGAHGKGPSILGTASFCDAARVLSPKQPVLAGVCEGLQ